MHDEELIKILDNTTERMLRAVPLATVREVLLDALYRAWVAGRESARRPAPGICSGVTDITEKDFGDGHN